MTMDVSYFYEVSRRSSREISSRIVALLIFFFACVANICEHFKEVKKKRFAAVFCGPPGNIFALLEVIARSYFVFWRTHG